MKQNLESLSLIGIVVGFVPKTDRKILLYVLCKNIEKKKPGRNRNNTTGPDHLKQRTVGEIQRVNHPPKPEGTNKLRSTVLYQMDVYICIMLVIEHSLLRI